MSATTTGTALEFRAWTSNKPEKKPLNDTLARVNQERGSFRELTESALQEEIATQGGLDLSSSEDEDEAEDEDRPSVERRQPATTREELYKAKGEMLQHVQTAQNEIILSLQAIALMESKHAPGQAAVSIVPDIKQNVPLGSLGTDVWDASALPVNEAREAQDRLLASKVRMQSLQQSADDILTAAARLQENVRKETVFWDEILAVRERNWNISRIPGLPLLGVHFGFNGCAPEFAKRNIAALIGDSEGSVSLERGIGTKPKALRAIVKRDGKVVGASELPSLLASGENTLDARIRHARDSVFDEELFHELLRESRSSASLGVTLKGSSLCFDITGDNNTNIELELVSLEEGNTLPYDVSHESDALAKAMLLTARLLLSQKHRDKINRKREVPGPMAEKAEEEQSTSVLRPLLLLIHHHSHITTVNKYLESVSKVLRIMEVSSECQTASIGLAFPMEGLTTISSLMKTLSTTLTSEGSLWMIPSDDSTLELKFKIQSLSSDRVESTFTISATQSPEIVLDDLADTLAAADEILAPLLARSLKEYTGADWQLDLRDGVLSHETKQTGSQVMRFFIDSRSQTVALHASGPQVQKQASWALEGMSNPGALQDVWKTLIS